MILLLQLFLAHILGDFFLQTNKWVAGKELHKWRSPYLYLHAAVHFLLILLITWNAEMWKMALIISLSHLLVDGIKLQLQRRFAKRVLFFTDQLAHLAVIAAVWSFQEQIAWNYAMIVTPSSLIIGTAILFVLKPTSFIIRITISRWTPGTFTTTFDSLKYAGEWIGMLERLMILAFILLGRWEGVGFLLAAKSVFRFGDLKESKETQLTEYVVIGTFLSFGIAMLTGIIAGWLLNG